MTASSEQPWVAVMIDGENIAATLLPTIMSTAKQYGDLRIRRVYGAMGAGSNLQAWEKDAPRYGLQLCHVPHTANKKNGTDIALVVDTMLLLAAEAFDILCLVANDSDYIPLIQAVHASNRPVVGMSAHPNADIVRHACTKYHPLTDTAPKPPCRRACRRRTRRAEA
ncbi:MAG: NYN domain-containing protein, partial [Chloroflexaceae bacterium]|nr:NYN domain-containing protein [Chloroflexaceae bacterium]